jgi:fibronectin-binding autotransporter adhesin
MTSGPVFETHSSPRALASLVFRGRALGCWACCQVALAAIAMPASAASYSYTTSGASYTQDFDTLPATGSYPLTGSGPFDTDAAPISAAGTEGWQFWKYTGNTSAALFSPNNGSGTSGSTYSYGTTDSTDRALGALASGSGSYRLGLVVQNNTGETLTSFTLSYLGEQWRWGGSTNINTLVFDYSIGSSASIDSAGAFTANPDLDFASPVSAGTAGPLDGNLPENQRSVSATVGGLAWAAGDYLILRWSDTNDLGSDDGLALDNVSFTATGAVVGANLYWGGVGGWTQTSPGAGGSGTWGDGAGGWDSTKTANFAGPGGAVTISGTATAQSGVTFAENGYVVGGGTLLLAGSDNLLAVNPDVTARINSVIAGSSGFTKAGQGTLVLGGSNNFLGQVSIGAGTLSIGADAALGDPSNAVSFSGGSLATTATLDLGVRALSGAASIDIAAGTTLSTSGAVNLSTLALPNTGTLALNGFGTTVGNIAATAGSGTARVEGSLDFGASGRTVTVATGGTLELAGSLTSNAIIDKAGEGTLVLSGDNAGLTRLRIGIQGATPVAGGTVQVSSATGLGSDPVYFNYGTIEATTPLVVDTGLSIGGKPIGNARLAGQSLTFNGPIGTFNASGTVGDVTLIVDNDTTFLGDVTSTAPLTIGGAGTLRIAGYAEGLTAAVTLADTVTLSVESGGSVGSSLVTVGAGATLAGDGTVAAFAVADGGTLAPGLSPGTLIAGAATLGPGGNYNFQISDAASSAGFGWDLLDVTGSLTVTATTADPFAVNLWSLSSTAPDVNGNAANFDNQAASSWTFARAAGGFVDFSADKFTVNTAAVNGTGGFTNPLAGGSFSVAASGNDLNVVFTPFVPGASLEWFGNGTSAGGSGSWSSLGATWSPDGGTTVGTWDPARRAIFGTAGGTVTVQGSGISAASGLEFTADGYTVTGGTLSLTGGAAADNTVTVAAGNAATIASRIQTTAGLTKAGPGRLVLSGTNSFSGGTTVSGGTLQVGNGTTGSLTGDVAIETGGRLVFDPGATTTFAGGVSGTGLVEKAGSGSLTLSGANSHTGGTRLEAGSLTAAGGTAFGSGTVTAIDGNLFATAGTTVTNPITVGEVSGGGTPVLVAGWDFQTTDTGGTAVTPAPTTPNLFSANLGTGTLYLDGTNGSSGWTAAQLNGFSGTDVNAGPGFSTVTTSPASLALVGSEANGQQAVFAIDMTGYSLLDVSYATRYSGANAFTSQEWSVSTDGTTWQTVETVSVDSTTFLAKDLATITALAGSPTAYLRLTVDGATSLSANNRLDNVQLLATPGSLPSGTVVLGSQATSGTAIYSGDVVLNQSVILSAAAGGRVEFSGAIGDGFGQNGVTKQGAGTVALAGANTYAGLTTVSAGSLIVNGTAGAAGVTVSGGTVGGQGAIGPLTLAASGMVSPGDAGVGSFTAAGVTAEAGSGYLLQIADAASQAGTGWDLLESTAGLDVTAFAGSPFTIDLWTVSFGDTSGPAANFSAVQPYRWTFLDTGTQLTDIDLTAFAVNGSPTAASGGFANDTQGGTFSVAISELGSGLDVVFTPNAAVSSLTWYGEDAVPGGKGTWASLNVNWSNGSALQTWDPTRTAVFGTVGGEVTIGPSGISADNGVAFQAPDYVVGGGPLTLGGGSRLINSVTVESGVEAIVSAVVSGTAGMTKAGEGTLVLTAANPLSGGVTVSAGTLQLGAGGASGSLSGDILLGASGTLAVNRSDAYTLSSPLTGTGRVAKSGIGSLVLTGASNYSGGTAVAEGTVVVGDGGVSGEILSAGSLDLATGGVLAFDRSDAVGFTGRVTGGGTLAQRGSGTLTLSRGSPYGPEFTLQVAAGTVDLNRGGASLADILGAGNTVELSGGTLQLTSNSGSETRFSDAGINVQASSTLAIQRLGNTAPADHFTADFPAPITVANSSKLSFDFRGEIPEGYKGTTIYTAPVTLASAATFSVANSAGGTAEVIFADAVGDGGSGFGLTLAGPQQLTLAGVNTYSGPTTVSQGTLALGADGTIDASPTVVVESGATFDVAAKTAGYAVPAGQTLTGTGSVVGGLLLGTGGTVSPGDPVGTLTTSADVTFGGGGNYNWQLLDAQGTAGSETGWDLLAVGGPLAITASSADPFAINLWSLAASDPLTGGPAAGFDAGQAGSWTIASATGGITGFAADAFTVVTSASNGTTGFANPLAGGSFSVTVSGNDLNLVFTPGTPQTTLAWYGNGSTAGGNGTWSSSGTTWWNGSTISAWNPSAKASFGKPAGKVTIAGGGVSAANGLVFGGDGYTVEGDTLTLSGATAAANTIEVADLVAATITAPVAGTAGFVKTGPGSLSLAGTNTISGSVTVSAGSLEVATAGGLTNANVTVDTAATLAIASGTTMRAPSVIVDGGTLSAEILAVNGTTGITALAINAGSLAGSPATTVSGGGSLSLVQDARVTIAVGSLDVVEGGGGGRLDVGAGQVSIAAGGISAAALRADLIAGRNGGAWNGASGIMSSTAAASGGTRTVGYVVAGTGAATVSYAAAGDTNLNGQVDVFDLVSVNSGGKYGTGTAAVWSQGDFNYDGVTNVFDLVSINGAGSYGRGNYFPAAPSASGSLGSPAAVPEPGALLASGLLALATLGRSFFASACRRR